MQNHPNSQPNRFKSILFQMQNKSNIFGMTLLAFRKVLCLFSDIIDVINKEIGYDFTCIL